MSKADDKPKTESELALKNVYTKQRYCIVLLLCCLIGFSSCGEEADDSIIERDVELPITIESGLYGQVTSTNDVGSDNTVHYMDDFDILIFDFEPDHEPNDLPTPLFSGKSREDGVYEIEMESGEYFACTTYLRCIDIEILPGQLLRCDFDFGVGPGWSCFAE